MGTGRKIIVSAPCKIHLLGEWAVVWGKPAILASVDLRVRVTISQGKTIPEKLKPLQKIIEKIVKKELNLKRVPLYSLEISSDIPIGAGLGSSASVSAAYIGALLTYLRVNWNLYRINKLTYEAEKIFHGNPSGGDNSTVVFGNLIWFRKENVDLKLIQKIPYSLSQKLVKNFYLINTGTPNLTTKQMITKITEFYNKKPKIVNQFLEGQEDLVKQLLNVIKKPDSKDLIKILKQGQTNLETLGVCSEESKKIIRKIEKAGGAAKICGAGAFEGPTGVLLCFHKSKKVVASIAKSYNLPYFSVKLGVEGVKLES